MKSETIVILAIFVAFAAAELTRRYPEKVGVENLEPVSAARRLFWPIVPYDPSRMDVEAKPDQSKA